MRKLLILPILFATSVGAVTITAGTVSVPFLSGTTYVNWSFSGISAPGAFVVNIPNGAVWAQTCRMGAVIPECLAGSAETAWLRVYTGIAMEGTIDLGGGPQWARFGYSSGDTLAFPQSEFEFRVDPLLVVPGGQSTAAFRLTGGLNASTIVPRPDGGGPMVQVLLSTPTDGVGIATATFGALTPEGKGLMQSLTLEFTPSPVPEPATLAVVGLGLAATAARSRRRSNHR